MCALGRTVHHRVVLEDMGEIVVGRNITSFKAEVLHHHEPNLPSVSGPDKETLEVLFEGEEEVEVKDKQVEELAEEETPAGLEVPAPGL